MKKRFGSSSKDKRASTDKSEPQPSHAAPGQQASSTASSSTARPVNLTNRQPPANTGREKPSPPVLSEVSASTYYAEPLPAFKDVSVAEKQSLFVKKLHLCAFTFDFTDSSRNVREKEIKRQTLVELVDYVNTGTGKFTEAVSEDIIFMLSANLFRALPPTKASDQDNLDPDEEEPALEPAWPHLQVRCLPPPTVSCMVLSSAALSQREAIVFQALVEMSILIVQQARTDVSIALALQNFVN